MLEDRGSRWRLGCAAWGLNEPFRFRIQSEIEDTCTRLGTPVAKLPVRNAGIRGIEDLFRDRNGRFCGSWTLQKLPGASAVPSPSPGSARSATTLSDCSSRSGAGRSRSPASRAGKWMS